MKSNFTCTCDSPLVEYEGSWAAEVTNNTNPPVRMVSNAYGDSATLNFTGTSIWIYPGSSTPRASYEVWLDGTPTRFNATMADSDITKPLFKTIGMPSIPHHLSIRNTGINNTHGTTFLDLLSFVWEERDRDGNASTMAVSSHNDDSSSFSYHPSDMWTTKTEIVEEDSPQVNYNATIGTHTTNASHAWVEYNFSANAVSIYGDVGPSQGPYSVMVLYVDKDDDNDNGTLTDNDDDYFDLPGEQSFNASFPFNRTKVLLYHLTNINSSRLTMLRMINRPDKPGDSLSVDCSVLFTYASSSASSHDRHFPVGAFVGSIIGPIAIICLLATFLYLLRRRRQDKLIRRQRTNMFRDLLVKRGILSNSNDGKSDPNTQANDNALAKGHTPADNHFNSPS